MIKSILVISLLASPQGPVNNPDTASYSEEGVSASTTVLLLPEGSHALVVEKNSQSLFLFRGTRDNIPELLEIIRANTGEKDGDKRYEGDLRTPEGIYFFTGIIDGSVLPPEYGIRAFVTDYPNIFDRLDGKYGSNIWLHATDQPERVSNGYNTRGCVVLTNEDLDQLTQIIRTGPFTGSTAMVVEEELGRLDSDGVRKLRNDMQQLVIDWEAAWESMDIDRFMDFYSTSFSGMERNYRSLRSYKGRLTRQYDYIEVDIYNLHLFSHDGEIVVAFDQRYESNNFLAHSAKRLYFRLEKENWKIVTETSRITSPVQPGSVPLTPEPVESVPAEPYRIETVPVESVIEELVTGWESAWESRDTNRYMAFYSKSFRSRGMDYPAYRTYKNQLNDRYSFIEVEISGLKIYRVADGIVAEFDQRYESDSYHAISHKRLRFKFEEGVWKIVGETSGR